MNDTLFLTWQYIKFNRRRLTLIVTLVTLAAWLPLALDLFADEAIQHLRHQARSTSPGQGLSALADDFSLLGSTLEMMVGVVAATSVIVVLCVLTLSFSARRGEIEALSRLGCSPMRVGALLAVEFVLLCLISGFFAVGFLILFGKYSADLMRFFLMR